MCLISDVSIMYCQSSFDNDRLYYLVSPNEVNSEYRWSLLNKKWCQIKSSTLLLLFKDP